ncbi:hypothetical protein SAMN05216178_4011 [Pseudomonas saponiphila]|uniref:Uncharacterized protein n=1 Tax=Pseudomonas saponiphila TaxID=556534 RepID=A0A1H4R2P8_9PSED|nr:hypothetical protein [Pseudomonas saponiphila]SEC26024.1 hypothetical protein SAMN05216178_4011 [Pseudomonas saponiphila]
MFNMATMAADECREDAQERIYYRWIDKASELLGHEVALGSQEESDLHDLYADSCTPSEAVTELLAQAELARAA